MIFPLIIPPAKEHLQAPFFRFRYWRSISGTHSAHPRILKTIYHIHDILPAIIAEYFFYKKKSTSSKISKMSTFTMAPPVWLEQTTLRLTAACSTDWAKEEYKSRHRSIFPGSHPPSIFDTDELNFCVRNGNRWILIASNTDSLKVLASPIPSKLNKK